MAARAERLARISLLTGAALAALLVARQGRDAKALAGVVCALAALAAVTQAVAAGGRASLRRSLPSRGRLTALWLICLIPIAGYALLQKLGQDPSEEFARFHSADRPFATFGNPDFLGAFLAFMLPIALARLRRGRAAFARGFMTALIIALAAVLLWTGSRGAWLGAAAGLAAWGALTLSRADVAGAVRTVQPVAIVAVAGLLLLACLPPIIRAVHRRTDRVLLWTGTLSMIRAHPVTGWGPGRFAGEYPPFAPPAFAQRMKDDNTFAEHPHSEYLHIWVEYGAVGLGLFLWVVAIILREGVALARAGHPVAGGLTGGMVAILVHVAVDRNFRLASTAVPFWTAAAALWSRRDPSATVRRSSPWPVALAVAMTLFAGARVIRPWLASVRVEREGDFLKQANDVSPAELEKRRDALQGDPQYWIALGNAWAREKNFPRASDAFREGLKRDPVSTAAANNLGNSLFMMSRFEEAGAVYRGMLARDPLHKDARFNLAFTYYHQRRIKEALAEVAILLHQDPANAKALALKQQLAP